MYAVSVCIIFHVSIIFLYELTVSCGLNVLISLIRCTAFVSQTVNQLLFGCRTCILLTAPELYVSYISIFSG